MRIVRMEREWCRIDGHRGNEDGKKE
jgi:hypothetical protein